MKKFLICFLSIFLIFTSIVFAEQMTLIYDVYDDKGNLVGQTTEIVEVDENGNPINNTNSNTIDATDIDSNTNQLQTESGDVFATSPRKPSILETVTEFFSNLSSTTVYMIAIFVPLSIVLIIVISALYNKRSNR